MTTNEPIALVIKNKDKAVLAYEANPTPENSKAMNDAWDVYDVFYALNSHLFPKDSHLSPKAE